MVIVSEKYTLKGGKMIKLIICDLDGTLLPSGQKQIGVEIKNLIKAARQKGIMFVCASGRAYHELKLMFDDVAEYMVFMPSDGASTVYQEKTYYFKPLQKMFVEKMLKNLQNENMGVIVSGKYFSYYMGEHPAFLDEIREKTHIMQIYSMSDIPEDILKLSFFGEEKSTFTKKVLSGSYTNMMKLIYKNNSWSEFISPGAGKENAAKCMMDSLKIKPDEMVVFGNDTNDVEFLKLTPNSYAVKEAHHLAQKAANHITEDITKTLTELIGKGDI